MDVQNEITDMCCKIAAMLIEKNRKYGNSALNPLRVFSKADVLETIKVRMDDKLCRIKNEQSDEDEDVYMDLAGYLVLYLIARKQKQARRVGCKEAKEGLKDATIDLTKVPHKTLEQRLPGVIKLEKFPAPDDAFNNAPGYDKTLSSLQPKEVTLDKLDNDALVILMVQALENKDDALINAIKDEEKRRGNIRKHPDCGCGFDDTSVQPTT